MLVVPKLEFLGYTIDKNGLHTSQSKVDAVLNAKVPDNVTEVFCRIDSLYAKFLPNLATTLSPLNNMNKNKLKWSFRDNTDTYEALSRILFDYRNAVHLTTNETPAKLMFNRNLRTRFDLLRLNVSNVVQQKQDKQKV